MIVNTMKTIEQTHGRINPRYDLCKQNILDIANSTLNQYEMIMDSFVFGYAQGVKAAKAEMKKAKEAVAV